VDLFEDKSIAQQINRPLADRIRPETLSDFIGQRHLLGQGKMLRRAIESDRLVSMILWGPPGTGKTTLARIIANHTKSEFFTLSAVTSGVADLRRIIATARKNQETGGSRSILFIDEIHRYSKSQQDALLHSVEDGTILLIGATTENPSFEIISALLSRCRVYKLESLKEEEMEKILRRSLRVDERLKNLNVKFADHAAQLLIRLSGGDARIMLNTLELSIYSAVDEKSGHCFIDRDIVEEAMQRRTLIYDKQGDYHYDVISAFIKSVRGSDPDAAIYWLARMIDSGEDPKFIARRLIILASEDIGNADPHALMVATSAFEAISYIGMPEGRIILAQATAYLASAPKSNASYLAIEGASEELRTGNRSDVPLHLRNAPTKMMKDFGYATGYKYPHDSGGFVRQDYFPADTKKRVYYRPTLNGIEKRIKERLAALWPDRNR
jgi:putative ATPase